MIHSSSPPPSGATADPFYARYYAHHGPDRNNILVNAGVLFQQLANDAALVQALRFIRLPSSAHVLDVGCGAGPTLLTLLRFGLSPRQLHGIDLDRERSALARAALPQADIRTGDAQALPWADNAFDLVFESTLFLPVDESTARAIASEMFRVCRSGGWIVVADWRFEKKGYHAMNRARVRALFSSAQWCCRFPGALVPPVGRWLSARAPWAYFAAQRLPLATGLFVNVLRKP